MPLTDQQLQAIESLEWLLDTGSQYRATGRSLALAVALIRQSMRHPGRQLYYNFVSDGYTPQAINRSYVEYFLHLDPQINHLHWAIRTSWFRFQEGQDPPENWLPSPEVLPSTGLREPGEIRRLQEDFSSRDSSTDQRVQPLSFWDRLFKPTP